MLNEQTIGKLYNKLTLRTDGLRVQDLADSFEISDSEVLAAVNELASRGLVRASNNVVRPVPWWDAERIDLFLNVPRMPEEDFAEYCREIDALARQMRARGLPVLRPYSSETVLEILLCVGAVGLLVNVVESIADFVERVRTKRKISYVELKGILRSKNTTEIIISIRGTDSRTILDAFNSVIDKVRKDYGSSPSPSDRAPTVSESRKREDKIRILFLAANPRGTSRLRLDEEIREITDKIRAADFRDSIQLFSRWAVRPDDLLQSLNEHRPHVVHLSGHGGPFEEITLEDKDGEPKPVNSEALASLFRTFKENIRVVVLNACYSRPQAQAITKFIDCTIGISKTIKDEAAIAFAASFYRAIGFGCSVQEAFEQGKTSLMLANISEKNVPELMVRKDIDPSQVVLVGAR